MATISGTSANNRLTGADGADILYGLDGNDVLDGGEGGDVYDGGNGNDVFLIWGDTGIDTFRGGAGTDMIRLTDGASTASLVLGTKASVERIDFAGADLTGTEGDDLFDLRGVVSLIGRRTIWLNDGDDTFIGSSVGDDVHGGTGDDRLDGGAGDDRLEGGIGNDTLIGGSGNDRFILRGQTGIDSFDGGAGTDRIVIAGGTQTRVFTIAKAASVEILRFEGGTLNGTDGRDVFDLSGITGYENRQVIRLGAGTDRFTGSSTGDAVDGGNGNDILDGGAGNDILEGGGGSDTLIGGSGNDIFLVQGRFGADLFQGGAGTDTLQVAGGGETMSLRLTVATSVEVLHFTGHDLSGTDEDDIFDLSGISNIIARRTIWLNDGDDRFTGSKTGDDVHGGLGDDVISTGAGNDIIEGGQGNDTLNGGDGNDVFHIQGEFGADTIRGGSGRDTVLVIAGAETSSLILNAAASVEVLSFDGKDLVGTDGNDRFDLSGVNTVTGRRAIALNAGNDSFIGSSTGDIVHGGAGNDVIYGAAGGDILNGGTGRDRFVYKSIADSTVASAGRDRIDAFSRAEGDRVDLSAIDADTTTAGNQAFSFIGTGGYTGTAGALRMAGTSGGWLVYGDIDGDRRSDFSILVSGIATISGGDFIL
ncbi:hypothetical protein GCM10011505_50410 [Tistrella bauzanensis]|uniref:Calcium-binding protein n=1 Tax=Tistrella bauzanensis TaxID=657419 RepID=A0ABQ1JA28_9PROT|nr:calcium-binding protein [Tistrella bauzanensis]GGB63781.1 hypothetical protein GCM10011505_50410 [Tistrella bauzanensis]